MSTAVKMQAYRIDGGAEWFVRGTTDERVALDLVLSECPEAGEDSLPLEDDGIDREIAAEVARKGWFRFNPCTCGDHGWHLGYVNGPGRGRFEGVTLDVVAVEVQFDSDDPLTDL